MQESHGGNVFGTCARLGYEPDEILDFSNNASALVADITAEIVGAVRPVFAHYPDERNSALRGRIAAHEGVDSDEVMPGNGSAELIHLAMLALKPSSVLIVGPVFSEYERACRSLGVEYDVHTLGQDSEFVLTDADIETITASCHDAVILCSPNNPTGALYRRLPELLAGLSCGWCLVDCTYREFLHGSPDYTATAHAALAEAAACPLVTLHSFTKFFFCPGIRLGYALGDAPLLERLWGHRAPWMVPHYAEQLGSAFLDAMPRYRERLDGLRELKVEFREHLAESDPVEHVYDSSMNFFCARLRPGVDPAELAAFLAHRRILIRDCTNITGMPPGHIRVQVRPREESEKLFAALSEWGSRSPGY